jgi:nucleoside-diphosphate-sugar epimerase
MRLFVTGGTGFIGSHFLAGALASGHEVLALKRPGSTPRVTLKVEPEWLEGELTDDWHTALRECDALVHFAAAGVNPSKATWESCFRTNVTDSLKLWMRAIEAGITKFVVSGSCFEYGRAGERYEFIPPDAPLEPTGPYHSSKAAATMAAIGLAVDRKVSMAILRPFHVFGPEEKAEYRFWPSLVRAAQRGEDFPMTLGEQIRDFVPVELVARAFLLAAQRPPGPGHPTVENVGSGQPQSLREFAEKWWKQFNAQGRLIIGALPYRPDEVMRYVPLLTPPPEPHGA